MFLEQRDINRRKAFEHLVEIKKQNKDTIMVNGNLFSYITKRGMTKRYIALNSFEEFRKSKLHNHHLERVNGFLFLEQ